jgi:hypothetical protein
VGEGDGCEDGSVVGPKEGDFERLGASDAAILGASLENAAGTKETDGSAGVGMVKGARELPGRRDGRLDAI